jgi:hypothetical protein
MYALPRVLDALERDPAAAAAWDARVARIESGTATDEDRRVQSSAAEAANAGRPFPPEARRLPAEPPVRSRAVWDADRDRAISLGIPPLLADDIVGPNVGRTPAIDALALLDGRTTILVLSGERGAGKSFAAACWLWRWRCAPPAWRSRLRDRTPPAFVPYDRHDDMSGVGRDAIARASALVLDDVAAERYRDAMATTLVRRHRDAAPTVVTTNLREDDFAEAYGARVADRLREVGRFVTCGARSLRRPRGGSR